MKILVMGGTGALGEELVPLLAKNKENKIVVTSRKSIKSSGNINYIMGNAKSLDFILPLIKSGDFDFIVDFMLYSVDEFKKRYELFLNSCKQYIFMSSARVYAPSNEPLNEDSARLLDVSNDKEYLKSNEYSIIKAYEEDILRNSLYKNWIIVRPYKTYSNSRLQLGVFEMNQWLHRAIIGKTVVVPGDIKNLHTSLTSSKDTAKILKRIIGDLSLNREIFQIANPEHITWGDVVDIYSRSVEKRCGIKMNVCYVKDTSGIELLFNNSYRIKYDGLIDRSFDDSKIKSLMTTEFKWTAIKEGLSKCVDKAIRQSKSVGLNYSVEGMFDRITGEQIQIYKIPSNKERMSYLLNRCVNEQILYKLKKHLRKPQKNE